METPKLMILDKGMQYCQSPATELARQFLNRLDQLSTEERSTLRKVIDQLIASPPVVMAPHALSEADRERIKSMFAAAIQVPTVDADRNQHHHR